MLEPRSPQPRRQAEQRRAAVADADQQAARRIPGGWGRGRPSGPTVSSVSRARSDASPARAGAAGLEHELHRAAVIRADVMDREARRPSMEVSGPPTRDRDELARPEFGRDRGRDEGQRVVRVAIRRRVRTVPRI